MSNPNASEEPSAATPNGKASDEPAISRPRRRSLGTKSDPSVNYDPSRTYMMTQGVKSEPRAHFVGLLRPQQGTGPDMPTGPVVLEEREVLIGRQEGLEVSLADDWVSRRHARIRRVGDEYVLQDLGSSNGTYVDGVPIVSCVLRPGDWVQIGRNLFRFEIQLAGGSELEGLSTWLE